MNQTFHQTLNQVQPQGGNVSQIFGLIVPGRNILTDFVPTDHTGTKFTMTLNFPCTSNEDSPFSVTDLVFFLLPNIHLPENRGASLYWSAAVSGSSNASGFELLGALTPSKPSAVYRTGWASHEALLSLSQSFSPSSPYGITITLGVSIEPLESIANLGISKGGVEERKNEGKKIAMNLYNFLQSFDDGGNARAGWMTVPTNVFDRWFKRFEEKLKRDPSFFMKDGT